MREYFKLCIVSDSIKAAMVMGILEEQNIPVNIISKQDSNYVFLGESEIWIPEVFRKEAIEVLSNIKLN